MPCIVTRTSAFVAESTDVTLFSLWLHILT